MTCWKRAESLVLSFIRKDRIGIKDGDGVVILSNSQDR